MKPVSIRLFSLALALLLLLPAVLTACKPAPGPEDPTDSQGSVTDSLPIDTETSEPDAFENTLLLAADVSVRFARSATDLTTPCALSARTVCRCAALSSLTAQNPCAICPILLILI